MRTNYQNEKQIFSPPGDTIQETLDTMGMSQAELAERMGRPKEKINDIIKGREPITLATSFQLEKVLGIPISFWLNREKEYRKKLFNMEQAHLLEGFKDWLQEFPVREMKKFGWLPNTKEKVVLVNELLSFFGIASPDQWKRMYIDQEVSVAFRISLANTKSPHTMSAWLRMGEVEAQKMRIVPFSKSQLKSSLHEIKELAYIHPQDFKQQLQILCANCGVAVVYIPNLPKAPISGAIRWFHDMPLIQLSGRYQYSDHFWFSFFHEVGHIILHGKKEIFLENATGTPMDKHKEEEANQFAIKWLLNEYELKEVIESMPFTDEKILALANKFRTPPGIIVGRLQHLHIIKFSEWTHLRKKINLFQ